MGRFGFEDADNYGGNGGHGFFSLKNDKDTARVRFMYRDMQDVSGYAVHQIELDDKKRYVNCIRSYNDPMDKCPFCKAGKAQQAKLFVPIFDIDSETVKIWERGKKFFNQLSGLCTRYPNLVSEIIDVERNGKKGDQGTTYSLYPVESDDTTLEDLPEVPDIIGGLVLDKTADEMEYFLDYGEFPNGDSEPVTRRGRESRVAEDEVPFEEAPRRRGTSARGDRREAF